MNISQNNDSNFASNEKKNNNNINKIQEKSSNDHDENKENLMNDLETTVEIKEKVITYTYIYSFNFR